MRWLIVKAGNDITVREGARPEAVDGAAVWPAPAGFALRTREQRKRAWLAAKRLASTMYVGAHKYPQRHTPF